MDHIDRCVIGAGIIGLAIGRAIAAHGREVFVLERGGRHGEGVSSRNSEVIHAGIYYPKDSLKAITCVRGKEMLYEYCRQRGVGHRRCGKLIVATEPSEEAVLEDIEERARANGVTDLEFWDAARLKAVEPEVRASRAVFSPSTGIVDSHGLMNACLADFEACGGTVVTNTPVEEIRMEDSKFVVCCGTNGQDYRFTARLLINAAGLGAQAVAARIDGLDPATIPPLYLCKGNYFTMSGRSPFHHLIYPVPDESGAGLGVHATIDLGDQVKFGPDVEYIDHEDYAVSMNRLERYYAAVRRYYPRLKDGALSPGYAGIRPKLQGPGEPVRDFVIQGPADHGIAGLVQLFGIESPGLTSSLAIADHVIGLLEDAL